MLTVLSASSRACIAGLDRLGIDVEPLLAAAGLSADALADPDGRLPASAVDRLWSGAYAVAGDPALALAIAEQMTADDFPLLRYLGAHSRTLGACLERVARYFAVVDPRGGFEIGDKGGDRSMRFVLRLPDGGSATPHRPAAEFTLATTLVVTRAIVGRAWSPAEVRLPFPEPAEAERHRRLFGRVRFGAANAALVIPSATWALPVEGSDPALGRIVEAHAARLVAELPTPADADDPVHQTRAAIAVVMALGDDPSGARIAAEMGVGLRVLQRRLARAGTTLKAQVAAERLAQARVLLSRSDLATVEVAFALGFSDQTAFTRAFRRWTGASPVAWRRAHAAAVDVG